MLRFFDWPRNSRNLGATIYAEEAYETINVITSNAAPLDAAEDLCDKFTLTQLATEALMTYSNSKTKNWLIS